MIYHIGYSETEINLKNQGILASFLQERLVLRNSHGSWRHDLNFSPYQSAKWIMVFWINNWINKALV